MNSGPRIASLVPSVTELLAALGLAPWLVARTRFCTEPAPLLAAVPKVGGTKDVNLEKLRQLAPTHAIVNVDENRLEAVQALRQFVPTLLVTHPQSPDDVDALIVQMSQAFGALPGVAALAAALREELRRELQATPQTSSEVGVLYLIWRDPWMTVARDTYISRLLAKVGWRTLPALDGGAHGAARYPVLHGSEPWLPDVRELLLSSEPYPFDASDVAQAQALCPRSRVRLVDGALLSWYGSRTAAGLRYLRRLADS